MDTIVRRCTMQRCLMHTQALGWFGCRFKEEHGTKCFICKTKSTSDTCIYIPNINITDSILSLEYYLQRCSPNMKKVSGTHFSCKNCVMIDKNRVYPIFPQLFSSS